MFTYVTTDNHNNEQDQGASVQKTVWTALDCTGLYWAVVGCTGLYWAPEKMNG